MSESEEQHETYRSGDAVLVFDELAEEIRSFAVPYSLTGGFCALHEPIKFLSADKMTCQRSYEQHQSFLLDYQLQLQNTKVLATRRGVGNHAMMMEYCGSSMATSLASVDDSSVGSPHHPKCLPIKIFNCFSIVSSTTCHSFNDSDFEIADNFQNHEITVDFVHNFTTIMNCSVFFVYDDSSLGHNIRMMDIRFRQVNETRHSHRVSGNLGYKRGLPVIATRYAPFNATSEQSTLILDYFHPNHSVNDVLKLPSFRQNICHLDNITFQTIDFGHDVYVRCDVRLDDDDASISAVSNFTQVCAGFQTKINFYLMHNIRMKENQTAEIVTVVSEFGNPLNESDKWLAIESNLYRGADDGPVEGHFDRDDSETEFSCRNMVLSVRYTFIYGVVQVGEVRRQSVMRKVRLDLGTRLDLKFRLGEEMNVPIFVDVMFFDGTVRSTAAVTSVLTIGGFAVSMMLLIIL